MSYPLTNISLTTGILWGMIGVRKEGDWMSITKGFENRKTWTDKGYAYAEIPVTELLSHARALEAMLRKHEWDGRDPDLDEACLECGRYSGFGNHNPDCQLAKLLE